VRILFLTHRLPYAPNRGDRIRAYHLIRLLSAHHDVDLISLVHDDDEASRVAEVRRLTARADGARVRGPARFISALRALAGGRPLTHVLLDSPRIAPLLRERFASGRPDVVLAYGTGMARYALEPPLDAIPLLLDMVDVDSEKWAALGSAARSPMRWIYRREARRLAEFERTAIARAGATVVVSERERMAAERLATGRIVVVPNGVDTAAFKPPGPAASAPRVVFCGVFDYEPNERGAIWFVREVWPLIKSAEPRAHLSLVGMRPTRAVRQLAADSSIEVTGAVDDVRPYLWEAAVSIAPLAVARGLQNKVLEATAAGLASVVTPQVFDGLPEGIRPACTVAADAPAFSSAVVALLALSGSARRAIAGRADLAALAWPKQLAPVLDLLADVASAKPRR